MRKKVLIFVLCLVGALLLFVGGTVVQVLRYSFMDNAKPSDAIIVLGAAEYAGRPSPVFQARLDHAYDLYQADLAESIITTGGSQPGEPYSEGEAGQKYLIKKGIPETAIFTEEFSDTTKQNLMRSKEIAQDHELASFILVSDPFHMYRAKLIAEDLGLTVVTSPTRTSPISKNTLLNLQYVARETVLVILHVLFDV